MVLFTVFYYSYPIMFPVFPVFCPHTVYDAMPPRTSSQRAGARTQSMPHTRCWELGTRPHEQQEFLVKTGLKPCSQSLGTRREQSHE
jgi:hypothetical protein